jgi:hypothetical protein
MVDATDRLAVSAVRRTTIVAFVSSICFGVFFVASTQIESIRAQSPWDPDPWDAVISFTSQLVAAVGLITAARCVPLILGTSDRVVMRRVLRGIDLITTAITVTVAVDVIALVVDADDRSPGRATPWLVGTLWITATTTVVSLVTLVIAWRTIGRRPHSRAGGVPDPVAILATWAVDLLPEPFDRPTVVIGLVAIAAGGALSVWHTLVEGVLDNGLVEALLVTLIFATIEGLGVFVLGCASAWYLEIFPANATRRISSRRARW